jgi:hypothetical protein
MTSSVASASALMPMFLQTVAALWPNDQVSVQCVLYGPSSVGPATLSALAVSAQ